MGLLLTTTWEQLGGFNSSLPLITCGGFSRHIFAGCVPMTMAQVMRCHQFPTTYNWALMPGSVATTTTADFISDIHDAINDVYSTEPNSDCDGTSVSTSADMGTVLKSEFGYTSATYTNYN